MGVGRRDSESGDGSGAGVPDDAWELAKTAVEPYRSECFESVECDELGDETVEGGGWVWDRGFAWVAGAGVGVGRQSPGKPASITVG